MSDSAPMIPKRHAVGLNRGRITPALLAIGLMGAGVALAQAPVPDSSPFLPDNGSAKADSGETLELAGVSTVGDRTDLIFHDKTSKKNRWVRVGATADGITALKYDARLEQAVVRINGVEKVLTLRKGTGPLNAPMPPAPVTVAMPLPASAPAPANATAAAVAPGTPTPGAPAPVPAAAPNTPEAIAHQESEARMLVSDLLEIGMAQRKAYEEAQRKAAETNGAPPAAPPPAPAGALPAAPNQPLSPTGPQPGPVAPAPIPPAAPPAQN